MEPTVTAPAAQHMRMFNPEPDDFTVIHYGVPIIVTPELTFVALGVWDDKRRVLAAISATLREQVGMPPEVLGLNAASTADIRRGTIYAWRHYGARRRDDWTLQLVDDPWGTPVMVWELER
jgi:hypothetical protein